MADVVLVHPPVSFTHIIRGGYDDIPPIGILYLAAYLEKHGISVEVIDDLSGEISYEKLLEKIFDSCPVIVGFSATTPQLRTAVTLASAIKGDSRGQNISIGIGNCHASSDPDIINRYPCFDFCVIGEAEITFLFLVKKILGGEKIKGVFSAEVPRNLDEIPFPAYHLIDLKRYVKKLRLNRFPIIGTRGCPFKCIFCSRPGLCPVVRSRSAKNIVDEIERYMHVCGGRFTFLDDSFSLKKHLVYEFCDEINARGLKIDWVAATRFDTLEDVLVKRMVESGCKSMCFGIESGDERIRNEVVNKKITDSQIYKGLRLCKKYKLDVQLSFIVGLPKETETEIIKTAEFPRKLLKMGLNCIEIVAMLPAVPLPGSPLFEIAIEEGLFSRDIIDDYINGKLGDDFRDCWPIYIPKGISKKRLLQIRKNAYMSFYFSPSYILRRIKKDISSPANLKKDICEALSLIRHGRSKASFA